MKNIHILPTHNNKSKIAVYQYEDSKNIKIGELGLQINNTIGWTNCWSPRELYITSDEEIKDGDYYLYGAEIIQANGLVGFHISLINDCKKIILTTDPELKIQQIDDEFLQWFAKNKTCEFIEVQQVYFHGSGYYNANQLSEQEKLLHSSMKEYKIIIPTKEIKKYPIGGYAPGSYSCKCTTCKTKFMGDKRAVQCEPCAIEMVNTELKENDNEGIEINKQETLEEFAKKYPFHLRKPIEIGVKWQQERSYSKEDLKNAFDSAREFNSLDGVVDVHIVLPMGGDMSDLQPLHFTFDEWFEQFKKKRR